jgi:hypothetical protein
MARLYADENFDVPGVEELRRLGHEVLTAHEAGQAGTGVSDAAVLAHATQLGRAVLTFNRRHFRRLHLQVRPHKGMILCTWDPDRAALAARIHQALVTLTTLDDQLVKIYRPAKS